MTKGLEGCSIVVLLPFMSKLLVLIILLFSTSLCSGEGDDFMVSRSINIVQPATVSFDEGLVKGLMKHSDGEGIVLDNAVLIEDDSSGAGIAQSAVVG